MLSAAISRLVRGERRCACLALCSTQRWMVCMWWCVQEDVSRSLMDELDTSLNGEKFSLAEMKSFFQAKFDEGGFDYTSEG